MGCQHLMQMAVSFNSFLRIGCMNAPIFYADLTQTELVRLVTVPGPDLPFLVENLKN